MRSFLQRHESEVLGMLSGFDRVRLRGTLRFIAHVSGLQRFLSYAGVLLKDFGQYVQDVTAQVKEATEGVPAATGRPLLYLPRPAEDKEQMARAIAQRDGIREGLICTLKSVEVCWSYEIHRNRETKRLDLVPASRKCLHYYHYFIHPQFGFMHVRLQSWFPFNVHICLNGREWLARQLDAKHIAYRRQENCVVWTANVPATQRLFDAQLRTKWVPSLNAIVRQVHPAHRQIFARHPLEYYWSVDQSEWATDVLFRRREDLAVLYPRLIRHGIETLGCAEVMRYLGKKVNADGSIPLKFTGEVLSDLRPAHVKPDRAPTRRAAAPVRLKHRVNGNWLKMYDKAPTVLRVEAVINDARDMRVYRCAEGAEHRGAKAPKQWRRMRKGVADMRRRAELSQKANDRYLDAMATVEDTTPLGKLAAGVCRRVIWKGRSARGLNPLAAADASLLEAVNRGEFAIHGLRNRDLRECLFGMPRDPATRRRQSAQVTRRLRLLRAHGLLKKISGTNRYQLTDTGRVTITALLTARAADTKRLMTAA